MDLEKFNLMLREERTSGVNATPIMKQIKNCMDDVYSAYHDGDKEFIMKKFMTKVKLNINNKKLKKYLEELNKKNRKNINVSDIGSEYLKKLRDKE